MTLSSEFSPGRMEPLPWYQRLHPFNSRLGTGDTPLSGVIDEFLPIPRISTVPFEDRSAILTSNEYKLMCNTDRIAEHIASMAEIVQGATACTRQTGTVIRQKPLSFPGYYYKECPGERVDIDLRTLRKNAGRLFRAHQEYSELISTLSREPDDINNPSFFKCCMDLIDGAVRVFFALMDDPNLEDTFQIGYLAPHTDLISKQESTRAHYCLTPEEMGLERTDSLTGSHVRRAILTLAHFFGLRYDTVFGPSIPVDTGYGFGMLGALKLFRDQNVKSFATPIRKLIKRSQEGRAWELPSSIYTFI